jgi:cytochrome bd-type quinol oxidase subunit 2
MNKRKIHFISGLTITIFIVLHLSNHLYGIFGAVKHIEIMLKLRHFYRNFFIETILILAVFVQIISGLVFFMEKRKKATNNFDKLQIWSGLYLAFFFVFHLAAVFVGRFFLNLDTNFYFGVAGLNNYPSNLFFIPYYGIAIISLFGHIAAIHIKK